MFSAIGPVSIMSSIILLDLETKTQGAFPINVKAGNLIIGCLIPFYTLFGTIPARYFGRKTIFIATTVAIAITHGLIALTYHMEKYLAMYIFT